MSSSGSKRPFRFLASVGEVLSAPELGERARKAEALGYHGLVWSDHLLDQPAPIPAMAVAAAATTRLRVGTFVLNNDLRHPAVLAQDLATLDVLSGGRLIVGIGAGWNVPEYTGSGIPFQPGPVRVTRLEESVRILKGLFAGGPFSFQGKHYTISEMAGGPHPVQLPHPPFLIGGGGRRLLRFAAREAAIVGLAPRLAEGGPDLASALWPATAEKVDWIREAAGERLADLDINTYPSLGRPKITDRDRPLLEELSSGIRERYGVELSVDQLRESPHVFVGTVDNLVAKCNRLRDELGVASIMTGRVDDLAPVVERLAGG